MAKKRKKKSTSFGKRLVASFGWLATLFAGTGLSGWAYPELPIVGKATKQIVAKAQAVLHGSPRAGEMGQVIHQVAGARGTPQSGGYGATGAAAGASSVGRVVSSQSPPAATAGSTVTIASFNIQVFGESKMRKQDVMNYLVQIVRRFDLVAIQEIRSKNDAIIPDFVRMINADGSRYNYVVGPRLGRSNSKEQYAFIYDTDLFEVDSRSVLTIDDPADSLHREPLLARFRVRTPDPSQGFTFWLMNTHTDPDEVPEEVDALAKAFVSVQQHGWGEDDVILLGDLNASEKQLGQLGKIPEIRYVIAGVPTNTRGSKTYDNILFNGRATAEFTGQAGVGDVMQHFGLTVEQALKISDHLPVWASFSAYEGGGSGQVIARQR